MTGKVLMAAVLMATLGAATVPADRTAAASPAPVVVPAGVTAGVAVFDRRTGRFTARHDDQAQFRSASVVKLLIALDYLWDRGPSYEIPDEDRALLEPMLRSSDDAAASRFWRLSGYEAVVNRMVARLGLRRTAPPPASMRTYWGYTAISAADTVRIYRYLLDEAPPAVRAFVLDNLRRSTRCAADSYDQSFGIPSVFGRPWAVKQGWSGFGDPAPGPCAPALHADAAPPDLDLVSEALHTTGVVGPGDRWIVVVLTLHPDGTTYARATADLTTLTRGLPVPGATTIREPR
ncbi:hypothetical protein [Actinoplanes sp. NPDC026619]|uniref:hypothetical protein n=1 Tax=Actinoplanes sp. NPDC026619 TaxID=3155798 RepID=UPI0033E78467